MHAGPQRGGLMSGAVGGDGEEQGLIKELHTFKGGGGAAVIERGRRRKMPG